MTWPTCGCGRAKVRRARRHFSDLGRFGRFDAMETDRIGTPHDDCTWIETYIWLIILISCDMATGRVEIARAKRDLSPIEEFCCREHCRRHSRARGHRHRRPFALPKAPFEVPRPPHPFWPQVYLWHMLTSLAPKHHVSAHTCANGVHAASNRSYFLVTPGLPAWCTVS